MGRLADRPVAGASDPVYINEMRLFQDGVIVAETYRVDRLVLANSAQQLYWATHVRLGIDVVLHVQVSEIAQSLLPRAERAIRLLGRVRHPNVIAVLDHWILPSGHPVFVTEFVEGESLSRYLSRVGALEWGLAARVLDGVLRALNALHQHAIVHRNVTPESVFLCSGGREVVRLGGMTLAKSLMVQDDFRRITAAGDTVGLPAYVSPEQLLGHEIDPTSDLYSAALLGYEMMTGRLPDEQLSLKHLLQRVKSLPAPPVAAPGKPEIPKTLEALLMSALEPDPSDRPPSASAFLNVLIHVCSRQGVTLGEALAPVEVAPRARDRRISKRLMVRSRHPSAAHMRAGAGPVLHRGSLLVGVALAAHDLIRPDTHRLLHEVFGEDAVTFEVGQMFWFALLDPPDVEEFSAQVTSAIRSRLRYDTRVSTRSVDPDFVVSSDVLRGNSPPPAEVISLLDALTRSEESSGSNSDGPID